MNIKKIKLTFGKGNRKFTLRVQRVQKENFRARITGMREWEHGGVSLPDTVCEHIKATDAERKIIDHACSFVINGTN